MEVELPAAPFTTRKMELRMSSCLTWLREELMVISSMHGISRESAMAKLYCSEVAKRCADHCVQLHGGYGLLEEYEAERFYRDQRLLEIGEGTSEIQRLVIARSLGCFA